MNIPTSQGLAFAYDPDGYWVEIVKRHEANKIPNYFNFSQTMMRIKGIECIVNRGMMTVLHG